MLINFLKQSWLMIVAALVLGSLVSSIQGQLSPIIQKNAQDKLEREMKSLLVHATYFEEVKNTDDETVHYYRGKNDNDAIVGYAIKAEGLGYIDKISLLIAVNTQRNKLIGISILKSNETPRIGDKIKEGEFREQFRGCPLTKLKVVLAGDRNLIDEQIIAISGATISSESVTKILNEAVDGLLKMLEKSQK